ncbi:HNH endonuclease [Ochrobactrum phage vB_OspM_OC]|nr:HNH endonuclease [Ochrobactrum phage vB_OspM_OC]
MLTQEILKEFIDYNPETGICKWKPRDVKWFSAGNTSSEANCSAWNKKFAGKKISTVNGSGYITVKIFDKRYICHRLIWFLVTGEWPDVIDHINGIRTDNRWSNLRNVSGLENNKNMKTFSNNTSGHRGISKSRNKWKVEISSDGVKHYLGVYTNFDEAVQVRLNAEKQFDFHENHGR